MPADHNPDPRGSHLLLWLAAVALLVVALIAFLPIFPCPVCDGNGTVNHGAWECPGCDGARRMGYGMLRYRMWRLVQPTAP